MKKIQEEEYDKIWLFWCLEAASAMCISFQYHYTLLQSITKFFNKKVCLYLPWIKTNTGNYTKGIILFLLAYFYSFFDAHNYIFLIYHTSSPYNK